MHTNSLTRVVILGGNNLGFFIVSYFIELGRIDFFSFFFSDVKHTHKFDVFRLITRKLLITMQPEHYRISNKTYEREEKKKNMNSNKWIYEIASSEIVQSIYCRVSNKCGKWWWLKSDIITVVKLSYKQNLLIG